MDMLLDWSLPEGGGGVLLNGQNLLSVTKE